MRDGFADRLFHGRAKQILVEEPAVIEPLAEELDFEESTSYMVVQQKMIADCFLHGGRSTP